MPPASFCRSPSFNRIIALDPLSRTARVQPGVRNLAISEAAAPYGLYYAPDPSSQIACTIGGNVSENSGGVHCLKYGLTVHNVLSVRAITIDGEVVTFGSAIGCAGAALDSPGLDLMALMVGSEGMLAVISEVVVRLMPKPLLARVIMASFDDVQKAGDAVAAIIAAGIVPAGMEMMDRKATGAVEPFVKAGYDLQAEAILLVESDGTPEEVAEEIDAMERVLRDSGCTRLSISDSEAERLRFWSGRKNAFPAAGRISADYYCMDGTIPRKGLGRMLLAIADMERRYWLALHERLPCGRREPPSADPVRRQHTRRVGARRPVRRRDPGVVRRTRRHCHRRARRRASRRSIRCACSSRPPNAMRSSRSSAPSIRPGC